MKTLFAATWIITFCLVCIEPVQVNRSIDGYCFIKCIEAGADIPTCKSRCNK